MGASYRIAVLAMLAFTCWVPAVLPQGKEVKEQPISSLEEIEGLYQGKSVKEKLAGDLSDIQSKTVLNDDQKLIYKVAARYYVLRVTWKENVEDPEKMEQAVNEFTKNYATKYANHKSPFFNEELARTFREVFARKFTDNPLSSINAAQMLIGLGKGKSRALSDVMTDLIRDEKQHDALKHYAVKALADFFPLQDPSFDPEGDIRRVEALRDYIERPWPVSKAAKDEDKERALLQNAAIFYMRREAIQSLAAAQLAAVKASRKHRAQPAITLLRVLSKDDKDQLKPPPPAVFDPVFGQLEMMGVAERCQAAFGLCDLKPDANYHFDISVFAVGQCLSDFFEAYRKDQENLIKGGAVVFTKGNERKMGQLHWKILADRWGAALKNLKKNSFNNNDFAAKKAADAIEAQSEKMLSAVADYRAFNQADLDAFRLFLRDPSQRPATRILFKGNAAPEVRLGYGE